MTKKWFKSKTIWTCIIAIITAVSAYFTEQIPLSSMIEFILEALAMAFMRNGIK